MTQILTEIHLISHAIAYHPYTWFLLALMFTGSSLFIWRNR